LLYLNQGDGTFREDGLRAGLLDQSWTMGAVLLDYNLDGFLDLYVINYIDEPAFGVDTITKQVTYEHLCFENKFYRNNGDGSFREISRDLGLNDSGCGLAATATDFDMDGDIDLIVANDFGEFIVPNRLYRNDFPLDGFTEISSEAHMDIGIYAMGIAVGDYDNDLDLDYYFTNIGANSLLVNENGFFEDWAEQCGVQNTWVQEDLERTTGWGTIFADVDNDMDLDLFVSNGYVSSLDFNQTGRIDPSKLYLNNDNTYIDAGQFSDVATASSPKRGTAAFDYDLDGDIDLISVSLNVANDTIVPATILLQNTRNEGNWLSIKLIGTEANTDAIGSKILIDIDGKKYVREVSGGSSFASHNSIISHFGLADHGMVDSIIVYWPGEKHPQVLAEISANQLVIVTQETDQTTASSSFDFSESVTAFPIPARDHLVIELRKQDLMLLGLYNSIGEKMQTPMREGINRLNDLIPGVYFLRVEYINKKTMIPVIIF
ncbi:MAG: CRTAC1 family protein, partial [Saprospiraceae bacterium]|nr:CRTAC1 family protein [Saprospiraceae bacterium]